MCYVFKGILSIFYAVTSNVAIPTFHMIKINTYFLFEKHADSKICTVK